MTTHLTLDQAIEFQRAEIERDLRRQRAARIMETLRFCPLCHPELFDASLDFTPTPLFCRAHAAHFLARLGVHMHRDEHNAAQPYAPPHLENKECA